MKQINKIALQKHIIKVANDFYAWSSSDIMDYLDDINEEFIEENKMQDGRIKVIYKKHIEFTKEGKVPEIITWYKVVTYKNNIDYEKLEESSVAYYI